MRVVGLRNERWLKKLPDGWMKMEASFNQGDFTYSVYVLNGSICMGLARGGELCSTIQEAFIQAKANYHTRPKD